MNRRTAEPRMLHSGPVPQPAPLPHPPANAPGPAGTGSHFLSPVRLSQAQKRALVQALAEQDIGDIPSCQLFAGAAEYELGTYHRYARLESAPAPEPAAPPVPPSLGALKTAASALLGTLEKAPCAEAVADVSLGSTWTDARQRRLCCEVYRLFKACDLPVEPPKPARPLAAVPSEPVADPSSTRRFVRSLARTFGECFEVAPTLAPGSPFRRALELVTATAGIRLGSLEAPALSGNAGLG